MRTTFSRTGHILASAGAAIGVANLVIFPYRVHFFGAGAYVLAFIVFTLMMGVPMMILENAMGKRSGKNAIDAFQANPGDSSAWAWAGWFGMLTSIMVASFYLVLAGWTLDYIWQYIANYKALAAGPAGPAFGAVTGTIPRALLFTGLFTLLTAWISSRKLLSGVERLSKYGMPLLGLLIIFLIISLPMLKPGGVDYWNLLRFDWEALLVPTDNGELGLLHALGQSFFSLGLGAVCMLTYATHIPRETNVLKNGPRIVHLDTLVATMGAVLVVPLLGGIQGDIYNGPPLVFINLVEIFKTYGAAGQYVGLAFFILLSVAVLTSSVSLLEPPLRTFVTRYGYRRSSTGLLIGLVTFVLTIPVVLSCSAAGPQWLQNFAGMGPQLGYFNFLLEWFGSVFLLVNALLMCVYLLRRWTLAGLFDELTLGGHELLPARRRLFTFAFRWIIPVGILILLIAKVWTLL